MSLFNKKFWVGFALGIILCISTVLIVLVTLGDIEIIIKYSDVPSTNTIYHYEKIGECHYIFDVDTITNEVKRIQYYTPESDEEAWERKNSAIGRDE